MAETPSWRVKAVYDGQCPVCAKEMAWLGRRAAKRGAPVALADYTAPGFDPARYGTSFRDLHAQMHAVLPDGTLLTGVDAFRRLYAEVGLGWILAWTRVPALRWIADLGYGAFARIRPYLTRTKLCADGTCAVPGAKRG